MEVSDEQGSQILMWRKTYQIAEIGHIRYICIYVKNLETIALIYNGPYSVVIPSKIWVATLSSGDQIPMWQLWKMWSSVSLKWIDFLQKLF